MKALIFGGLGLCLCSVVSPSEARYRGSNMTSDNSGDTCMPPAGCFDRCMEKAREPRKCSKQCSEPRPCAK